MADSIEMAFLQDNARTEEKSSIIDNFIATDNFWHLFTPKHQVLYGSRGAGKTAIAKMASFSFLKYFDHENAKKIVNDMDHIGVFVNTDIRFVGSLKNKIWNNESLEERYFIWKFNINCLKAMFFNIESILKYIYGNKTNKIIIEKDFVTEVTKGLFGESLNLRLIELPDYISNYEFRIRGNINKSFMSGTLSHELINDIFSTEIFEPIQYVVRTISKLSERLASSNWLFFIDEAEFLTSNHHKIINSYMRTNPDRVFVKMATLPYHHHTLDTNIGVHLQPDDDFEYVHLDAAPIYELNSKTRNIYSFARDLFCKRINNFIKNHAASITAENLDLFSNLDLVLSKSQFETFKRLPSDTEEAIKQIEPYLDERAIKRANRLANDRSKFGNEIWRKVTGIISLIDDFKLAKGNRQMSCYSGVETFIRCTDGVPRRMINLFQEISREVVKVHSGPGKRMSILVEQEQPILSRKSQTRVLKSYSETRFIKSVAVPVVGPDLKDFISAIGGYMSHQLHNEKISTDIIGSFRLDEKSGEHYWRLVKMGVAYGFIVPNVTDRHPDRLIEKKGSFRLSYALCPKFNTFPRKGTARYLQGLIRARNRNVRKLPKGNSPVVQGQFDF